METGGTQEKGPDEAGKVVRIPRDWFGPPDELVPFGPRAVEADEAELGNGRNATLAAPLDPNSFWDESSSSIQDVVEAPAGAQGVGGVAGARAVGGVEQRLPARAYRCVPGNIGVREAVAGVVIAVVVGLSVVGWLSGQSSHPPARSVVAAVSGEQANQRLRWFESSATRRVPPRSRSKGTSKRHTDLPTRHSQAVEVVYHPSQVQSVPSPATGNMNSASSTTTESSRSGVTSGATEASAGAPPHSPPAFGAGSALGPISSPDG